MNVHLKPAIALGMLAAASAFTPAWAEPAGAFEPTRRYELVVAPDLRTWASASTTLNRVTEDIYLYGIRPYTSPIVDAVAGTVWSVFFTYTTMLWPHEFGHWTRAREVDSEFVFENFMPLLPYTTVRMPDNATNADRALLSVGGFEVNAMVARRAQLEFYQNAGANSDELVHAMLNKMFFPIYTLIFPADADDPITWTETRGDPVHFVLPVYERATGRPAIRVDGSVDPELVDLYHEAVILSLGWAVLDPGFIQQAMAFADSGFDTRDAWMPVRTEHVAWTWGTQFNPSPLGYELYFLQYLAVDDRVFEVALKYGRPMKNLGVRVAAPNLWTPRWGRLGLEAEVWDQDVYGLGGSASAEAEVGIWGGLGLLAAVGYKTAGYALGRELGESAFGAAGVRYVFAHSPE